MKRLSLILTALALIAATTALAQQLPPPPSLDQPTIVSTSSGGLVTTPAISRSGHIFITEGDAKLVVLNPDKSMATSAVIASETTCKASPVLNRDASRVYCATLDGRVVCFSVSYSAGSVSLSPLWTRQLSTEEIVGNDTVGTSLVATPSLAENESRLYVVTGSGSPTRGHGRLFALETV